MGHETHPDAPQRAAEHGISGYAPNGVFFGDSQTHVIIRKSGRRYVAVTTFVLTERNNHTCSKAGENFYTFRTPVCLLFFFVFFFFLVQIRYLPFLFCGPVLL